MDMEGLFGNQMKVKDVKRIVEWALNHPQGSSWFTEKWKLFNEQAIIFKKEGEIHLRRPDRVMLSLDGKQMVVVDFKFGTPRESYIAQVKEYMNLLSQMGYHEVKGYLWYVYKGEICEVI